MRPREGHGRTGPGRPSARPSGPYSPPETVRPREAGAEVAFTGDDGRLHVFDTAKLAMPGWLEPVAAAFAARTDLAGGLRTVASAESTWQTTRRFLSFLSLQQPPPFSPGDLTAAHLDAFHAERSRTMSRRNALAELRRMLLLLEQQPLKAVLAPDGSPTPRAPRGSTRPANSAGLWPGTSRAVQAGSSRGRCVPAPGHSALRGLRWVQRQRVPR